MGASLTRDIVADDLELEIAWFARYTSRCFPRWKNRTQHEVEVELGLLDLPPANPDQNGEVWVLEVGEAS